MRSIFFISILMVNQSFAASENICITGNPNDKSLINVFEDLKNPENEPIKIWRQRRQPEFGSEAKRWEQPLPGCSDPALKLMLEMIEIRRRNWSMKTQIRTKCIESAISTVGKGVMKVKTQQSAKGEAPSKYCQKKGTKYICPTEAAICENSQKEAAVIPGAAPCVTKSMAKYIAWLMNEGITCFNPNSDDPIDPRTIFKKLNNESQFGFFVRNRNGVGIHQLVPIANKEMLTRDRGYGAIIEPLKDLLKNSQADPTRKAACEPFRMAIEGAQPQSAKADLPYGTCGLLQPGLGVTRSIMIGLGTFSYISHFYKVSGENVSSTSLVKSLGFDPSSSDEAHELRDLISLAYYSSAGIRGGLSVFKETVKSLGCNPQSQNSGRCEVKNFLAAFKEKMSAYYKRKKKPDYFNKIDRQYKGIVKSLQADPNEMLSPDTIDTKGDLCIL